MGQSTSLETGNSIRYKSETSNLIKHNQVFHCEPKSVTNTNLLPLKNHLKPMLFLKKNAHKEYHQIKISNSCKTLKPK